METKITCQHTVVVTESEYKLLLHMRMLANRARQRHGEEVAIVRVSAAGVKLCNVQWNGSENGKNGV